MWRNFDETLYRDDMCDSQQISVAKKIFRNPVLTREFALRYGTQGRNGAIST